MSPMHLEHSRDEYLDLVDEHDQVIGRKRRSVVYAEQLSNVCVVNAFVINSGGELCGFLAALRPNASFRCAWI